MKAKLKRASKRTFVYIMSVLMIIQAIYIPSLTVYADDDVVAPSIGGDISYLFSQFNQKTIDITFLCEVLTAYRGGSFL